MNLYESWIKRAVRTWRDKGPKAGLYEFYSVPYEFAIGTVDDAFPTGEPIYERDWDLLVIVDACRLDLMGEAIERNHYPFVKGVRSSKSTGSNTHQWMNANFTDEFAGAMAETVYVCGNPFSDVVLDEDAFDRLIEVWKYGWDESAGTLPPRPITDEAIRRGREADGERMLVHYMQPHCPFLTLSDLTTGKSLESWPITPDGDVWTMLSHGEISRAEVWKHYRRNLETVLEDVELLLRNVDAETAVVASDHGNGLGKYGIYGHPKGMPFGFLRDVPWIEAEASDAGDYDPGDRAVTDDDSPVEERLRALGYR